MGRFRDQARHLEKVINVGLSGSTLSPLMTVPTRGSVGGFKNRDHCFTLAPSDLRFVAMGRVLRERCC
jgi:hypothetical protein